MKLPGWCESCRRVKHVNVSGSALATSAALGHRIVTGLCDTCRDAEEAARGRSVRLQGHVRGSR